MRSLCRFRMSDAPLDLAALENEVRDPCAGALVSFVGWVRNHNDGREVDSLEYQAYETLANKDGGRIVTAVLDEFNILQAQCIHRVGHLAIGDVAVWVGVSSAHRQAAFDACQAIIDRVKLTVPIWKKEYYAEGGAEWVNCPACEAAKAKAAGSSEHAHDHG